MICLDQLTINKNIVRVHAFGVGYICLELEQRIFVEDNSGAHSNQLKVGTCFEGKYTITGLLGQGGMSSVYLARHEILSQDVAIKVLHPVQV